MRPKDCLFCALALLILLVTSASSLKKKKKLPWKKTQHVGNTNGLTSAVDRGGVLANVADGVDESTANAVKREKKPARVVKQQIITKPVATKTFESLKKKRRRKTKKQRRKLRRKIRHKLKKLGLFKKKYPKECKTWKDCALNECCLWFSKKDKKRYCKKKPKRGQRCKPIMLPGLGDECPCQKGLTCGVSRKKRPGKTSKYRCHRVKYEKRENFLR